ncbi:hypothetical protein TNCV_1746381 [Trichonephila clavipes]|nr:hypothetical protein TNCV_1746381 [Trichonephila clavipes]
MCPSQYTQPLGAEVHEHMFRSVGQSEARSPVFKSSNKVGTHLSTHCKTQEFVSQGGYGQLMAYSLQTSHAPTCNTTIV